MNYMYKHYEQVDVIEQQIFNLIMTVLIAMAYVKQIKISTYMKHSSLMFDMLMADSIPFAPDIVHYMPACRVKVVQQKHFGTLVKTSSEEKRTNLQVFFNDTD